jgi:hypothetical protein
MASLSELGWFMAAIRQFESGGNYQAQSFSDNDGLGYAWGAYQFIDGTWNGYGGYSSARYAPPEVQDQHAAELMTAYFNRFGTWEMVAAAWFAGPDAAESWQQYGTNPSDGGNTVSQYVSNILSLFGQVPPVEGYGDGDPPVGGSGGLTPEVEEGELATSDDVYMAGGELLKTADGKLVLRYKVFGTRRRGSVYIEWEVTDLQALKRSGYDPNTAGAYHVIGGRNILVDYETAGDASEIGQLAEAIPGANTMAEVFDAYITQYFGPNNPAIRDPEIWGVIAQIMANPDATSAQIQSWIENTDYWQSVNLEANEWNDLSLAEQERRVVEMAATVADEWYSLTGKTISIADDRIRRWALQIVSGRKVFGEITERIKEIALRNPNSPWSRGIRQEQINQGQFGADTENIAMQLGDLAERWGIRIRPKDLRAWAKDIQMNERTQADFQRYIETQAAGQYPGAPRGIATADWARPFLQLHSEMMEVGDVGLFDKSIQQALQHGWTLGEYEDYLRRQPAWLETGNAQDELFGIAGEVGRMFGYQ